MCRVAASNTPQVERCSAATLTISRVMTRAEVDLRVSKEVSLTTDIQPGEVARQGGGSLRWMRRAIVRKPRGHWKTAVKAGEGGAAGLGGADVEVLLTANCCSRVLQRQARPGANGHTLITPTAAGPVAL